MVLGHMVSLSWGVLRGACIGANGAFMGVGERVSAVDGLDFGEKELACDFV